MVRVAMLKLEEAIVFLLASSGHGMNTAGTARAVQSDGSVIID